MSQLVKPVIENLFRQGDERGSFRFMQPVYMQIVKVKVMEDTTLIRLSDGVWTIAVRGDVISRHDLEMYRILKLTQYGFERYLTNGTNRIFLEVYGWEDAGPASQAVNSSARSLKMTDVQNWLHKSEVPISDQNQEWEPPVAARTSTPNAPSSNAAPVASKPQAEPKKEANLKPVNAIESISPYLQHWKILARCTKKSDVREFNYRNQPGTGKMFKVTFTDETGDIEATGFTEAVEAFYPKIVEGQQYYVEKMTVREANKKFNTSGHDFDLTFNRDTVITPALDTKVLLPQVFFKFVPNIADLPNHEINSNVDVIGVISDIHEPQQITSKTTNIPYTKREVELIDDSMSKTRLTLWGAEAENFDGHVGNILATKGVRLSDFNGISLSATRQSKIVIDPDDPKAHKLKGWYEAVGSARNTDTFQSITKTGGESVSREQKFSTIKEIAKKDLGADERLFFTVKARIATVFPSPLVYPACSLGECQKKVILSGDKWRCEKCNQSMDEPNWRYVLSMILSDVTSDEESPAITLRVSAFNNAGLILYGDRAKEFQALKEQGVLQERNRALDAAISSIQGREYIWNIQAQMEIYQETNRPRYQVTTVKPVNAIEESKRLLSQMGF